MVAVAAVVAVAAAAAVVVVNYGAGPPIVLQISDNDSTHHIASFKCQRGWQGWRHSTGADPERVV